MSKIELTVKEKVSLELQHKDCRDGKERDRLKVVLLSSEGWSAAQIAQALRLHQTTISQHITDYLNAKLKNNSGGSSSRLNQSQTEELIEHIETNLYFKVEDMILYVKEKYSVEYSVPGFNKWLHSHGFSYKKPKGKPHKADKQLQEEFKERYEEIKANIKKNDDIYFMDGVHPTQATKITCGWIRRGTTKQVETTGSRTRVNILGVMSPNNIEQTIANEYKTINRDAVVDTLVKLRNQHGSKGSIHLILDQAPYHRAQEVKDKAKELNINLVYLPPYSPNLNLIERLWKVMNEHVRNNVYFKSAKDFKDKIKQFFKKTLPKIAPSLYGRMNDEFQTI